MKENSNSQSITQSLYSQPEIGEYINDINKRFIEEDIAKAIIYTETNDITPFINLLSLLSSSRLLSSPQCTTEVVICCCDKMLKANLFNKKLVHVILTSLSLLLKLKWQSKYKISLYWELYYKIFFMETKDSYEFNINKPSNSAHYIHNFYSKAAKYIKPAMTEANYAFIKEEALQFLYHHSIEKGLDILLYFAPKQFIETDKEIQEVLFKLMKTEYRVMNKICQLFWIILSKKGQLMIDIDEFIKYYFAFLYRYITGRSGMVMNPSQGDIKNKASSHNKKPYSYVESMCVALLFNVQFIQYRSVIDEHFKLLIPTINLQLKHKYSDSHYAKYITFIFNLSYTMSHLLLKKTLPDIESQLYQYTIRDNSQSLMQRYKEVIAYLNPILHSLFLFDIKFSNIIVMRLFYVMQNEPFDKELLDILRFLYDNPEICSMSFIAKLHTVIFNLLNTSNFKGDNAWIVYAGIDFAIDKISSNNLGLIAVVFPLLSTIYDHCSVIKDKSQYTANANYVKLFALLNEKSVVIIKRLLPMYDMIISKYASSFECLYYSMRLFISKENKKLISNEVSSYIIENEVNSKYLQYYFIAVTEPKMLWLHCYNNLISIEDKDSDKGSDVVEPKPKPKPKWFLYDIDKLIGNNKTFEVSIHNEQRLLYYKAILSQINFRQMILDDKTKRQFSILIYVLLYQNDIKYHQLAYAAFNSILKTLLNCDINPKGIITYPDEAKLTYANELINHFVIPYQSHILNVLNTIDTAIGKDKSKKDKKAEGQLHLNHLNEEDYEKIVLIYLKYQSTFIGFINIFLHDNKTTVLKAKHIDIENTMKSIIDQYAIINKHIASFDQFNERLVSFNKYVPAIKNSNILDVLYANIYYQTHVFTAKTCEKDNKANLKHSKISTCIPSLLSLTGILTNAEKCYRHLTLFHHYADKTSLISNLKLLLSVYDGKARLTQNETHFHFINNPEKEMIELFKYFLFEKYIKDLRKINDNSVSSQTKMDVIISNALLIMKVLVFLQPYSHIEATNAIIGLVNVLREKNYLKLNALDSEIDKTIRVIKEIMSGNSTLAKNKLKAYPNVNGLCAIDDKHNYMECYNKIKAELNEKISMHLVLCNDNKKAFESQLSEYINKYYNDLYSNHFDLNTNDSMLMLIVLCNTLIILNRIDVSDNNIMQEISKYGEFIIGKVKQNSLSYELRKFYFDVYGVIIKRYTKAYKKYTITSFSNKDEYQKNKDNIIRNAKRSHNLNDYPVPYIALSNYEAISSTNTDKNDSIGDFNDLCNAYYHIKDWLNDKGLMNNQKKGSNLLNALMPQQNNRLTDQFISDELYSPNKLIAGNPHDTLMLIQPLISKRDMVTFYYFIQHHPNVITYSKLYEYFDKYIKANQQSQQEQQGKTSRLSLTCLLTMLYGLIRLDIIKKNYPAVKAALIRILQYYQNELLNTSFSAEIMRFIQLLLSKCSISEMEQIIPIDNTSMTQYSNEIYIEIIIKLILVYPYTLHLYFESNKEHIENIKTFIDKFQADPAKIIRYHYKYLAFIKAYLFGTKLITDNPFEFTLEYSNASKDFLLSLVAFKDNELSTLNEKVLFVYLQLFFFNSDLFLQHSDLLSAYLKPIIQYVSQKNYLSSTLQYFNQYFFFLRKPIEIIPIVNSLIKDMTTIQGTNGRTIVLNIIQMVFLLNIHYDIKVLKDIGLFKTLISVMDGIDSELKDSFSEFYVNYYNIIKQDDNKKVIDAYRAIVLKEDKDKSSSEPFMTALTEVKVSNETMSYLALTQLLRFRTDLPDYIQELILDIRKYYSKKNNQGIEAKIIKSMVMKAMDRYHNAYVYMQSRINKECHNALTEMSSNYSYFT